MGTSIVFISVRWSRSLRWSKVYWYPEMRCAEEKEMGMIFSLSSFFSYVLFLTEMLSVWWSRASVCRVCLPNVSACLPSIVCYPPLQHRLWSSAQAEARALSGEAVCAERVWECAWRGQAREDEGAHTRGCSYHPCISQLSDIYGATAVLLGSTGLNWWQCGVCDAVSEAQWLIHAGTSCSASASSCEQHSADYSAHTSTLPES